MINLEPKCRLKFDKQMMNEEFKIQADLYTALITSGDAFKTSLSKFYDYIQRTTSEFSWRNTDIRLWNIICEKYDEKDLINNYGQDIFYKDEYVGNTSNGHSWKCRKVLWNLELSETQYYVTEDIQTDSDGEYEWTDYIVTEVKDEK